MENRFDPNSGIISWFARNSVAANLLMIFIIVMGIASFMTIQRQMFPNIEINYITVEASYPGASPQEIEESIFIKIEESLKDITEIKRTVSRAFRGSGAVTLEIDPDEDLSEVLDKVKLRIDGIATFPAGMEPVQVSQIEFRQDVIEMPLTGDIPLDELKTIAREVEDELLQLGTVSLVDMSAPDDEIAIEIKPDALRKYNLTIADVSRAISNYS
ncbi:MAG TPA: acriflavin resistance protein, partial [Alteromonas australica]|nr:acriflavin resistance protein [Alteromonas australica]